MKYISRIVAALLLVSLIVCMSAAVYAKAPVEKLADPKANFVREVSDAEAQLRMKYVDQAKKWMGAEEDDKSHVPIIDIYNGHKPLALGYTVSYTDAWCSTFASAISIETGLTDIIPTECGCDRHIALFQQMGCWVEDDSYVPLPGDLIFYTWKIVNGEGDCQRSSDHVGIVTGVAGNQIIVIEGNNGDGVRSRCVTIDDPVIRGFATPKYSTLVS